MSQLLVAILASYGFARWDFVGKKALYLLFVGSWLVPFQVTMIPNYLLVSQMGLLNTITGVVIPQLCSAFAVMMLRQHLEAFPKDLLDAEPDGRTVVLADPVGSGGSEPPPGTCGPWASCCSSAPGTNTCGLH